MNSCSFIGNMGKDPRFFAANGGKKAFMAFSLAIQNPFQKGDDGRPKTDWLDFVAFGKTAELINEYVPTGKKLGVTARASKDSYTDKNGNKQYPIKFNVNDITFCEAGGSSGGNNNSGGRATQSAPNAGNFEPVSEEDLPF